MVCFDLVNEIHPAAAASRDVKAELKSRLQSGVEEVSAREYLDVIPEHEERINARKRGRHQGVNPLAHVPGTTANHRA